MTCKRIFIWKVCFVIIVSFFSGLLFLTHLSKAAETNLATKNVKANSFVWGKAEVVLANDGELIVASGDIDSSPALHDVLNSNGIDPKTIKSIEFTQPTSAIGTFNMFGYLPNLQKIIGLDKLKYSGTAGGMFRDDTSLESINFNNFDTSEIFDMGYMFLNSGLKELDLSSFDTSNVKSTEGMFDNTQSLTTLDLTGFDTSKNTSMKYMFFGAGVKELDLSSFDINNTDTSDMFTNARMLRQLTLGKKSQLRENMNIPDVPTSDGYTGHWQNVGNGTVDDPAGNHVWTSTELMSNFDAPTMGADTFVWQRKPATINIGETTDYKNDPVLSKYVPTAVDPLHLYRYNVVLNNDYPFYTKVEDGQTKKDNVANLGDKSGTTVYSQAEMPATYTYATGKRAGQATKFIKVSFDGNQWYWVDQHALNLDLKSRYPAVNKQGVGLIGDQFLGSTNTYGNYNMDVNSQMIDNAYNPDGQIIYQSLAKESDFTAEKDPTQALKAFNDNLDRAAKSWNDALGQPVLIKATDTNKKVTLKVIANPKDAGSATLSGNTGIDASLVKWALDPNDQYYEINLLFITMRHELGHSLGLDHTSNGQYYGMPDGYQFSIDDDVMNAILHHYENGHPNTQKTITKEDVSAIKLILSNHNFENPQPQTKKVVTTKQIDRAVSKP